VHGRTEVKHGLARRPIGARRCNQAGNKGG